MLVASVEYGYHRWRMNANEKAAVRLHAAAERRELKALAHKAKIESDIKMNAKYMAHLDDEMKKAREHQVKLEKDEAKQAAKIREQQAHYDAKMDKAFAGATA